MSLINDMLKELEKRPQAAMLSDYVFVGFRSSLSSEFQKNKKYYYVIATLVMFLVFISIFAGIKHARSLAFAGPVSMTITPVELNNSSQHTPQESAVELPTGMALLTGIALQIEQNVSSLRLLLSQNALYHINSDVDKNELDIVLERTHLLAALPKINYAGSGIESIQAFSDENNNLKLVLHLSPGADIKRLMLNDNPKAPELQIDLFYQADLQANAQKANTIPVTINNPIVDSTSDQLYQQAVKLSSTGQNADAIIILKKILATAPDYHQGRELLVSLLLQQKDTIEAKQVIEVALKQQPDDPIFIEWKARILVDEGNIAQAVKLLEIGAPALEDNPDYHAFIAALYQREGKASLAADLYKQLLTLQPQNSKWWLGLGIALDALGNRNQALEAYTNAHNTGGLNPELQAYVDTQLRTT